jgi:carboxymethylenebutenolidase
MQSPRFDKQSSTPESGNPEDRSRRDFVALSAAAGLAAVAGAAAAPACGAETAVVEKDVQIATPDGLCEAAFFHPATGRHPAVLIWTDAFGLRPSFRDMGRRLAAEGYAVLVPNPFYRVAKSPVLGDISSFDFSKDSDRAKLTPLMSSIQAPGAVERDASAFVPFLFAQGAVDAGRKMGVQGYCMGGPLMMRTAAAFPDKVGAGASFHGGGLVTDKPESPHLLAPRIKARLYIAVAANDDARDPEAKDKLRAAFAAAKVQAEIEVYPGAQHGWCVPDMPARNGQPIYSRPDAERAWAKLLALYRTALA